MFKYYVREKLEFPDGFQQVHLHGAVPPPDGRLYGSAKIANEPCVWAWSPETGPSPTILVKSFQLGGVSPGGTYLQGYKSSELPLKADIQEDAQPEVDELLKLIALALGLKRPILTGRNESYVIGVGYVLRGEHRQKIGWQYNLRKAMGRRFPGNLASELSYISGDYAWGVVRPYNQAVSVIAMNNNWNGCWFRLGEMESGEMPKQKWFWSIPLQPYRHDYGQGKQLCLVHGNGPKAALANWDPNSGEFQMVLELPKGYVAGDSGKSQDGTICLTLIKHDNLMERLYCLCYPERGLVIFTAEEIEGVPSDVRVNYVELCGDQLVLVAHTADDKARFFIIGEKV